MHCLTLSQRRVWRTGVVWMSESSWAKEFHPKVCLGVCQQGLLQEETAAVVLSRCNKYGN